MNEKEFAEYLRVMATFEGDACRTLTDAIENAVFAGKGKAYIEALSDRLEEHRKKYETCLRMLVGGKE